MMVETIIDILIITFNVLSIYFMIKTIRLGDREFKKEKDK